MLVCKALSARPVIQNLETTLCRRSEPVLLRNLRDDVHADHARGSVGVLTTPEKLSSQDIISGDSTGCCKRGAGHQITGEPMTVASHEGRSFFGGAKRCLLMLSAAIR